MPRRNWDSHPVYRVIVTRRDGSEYILESYPDEQRAHERAWLLAGCLEDCVRVRVGRDRAAKTHGRAGRCCAK